ncbi:MAG: Xanthine dehydrogenase molybdenum-binding subunit [Candidatus Heimdallarchaeota archaeon LC_2]|nr:MAG: Xanthine dehydrogenase molybdenum-binding subunit [Candidatus Heimdallarchaeota archaeon LC_2]
MKNIDSYSHVRGESIYIDDMPNLHGTVYGVPFSSAIAHGEIKDLDFTEALESEGVVSILIAKDIPGKNIIGRIIPDEELLSSRDLHFVGQPIALILAKDEFLARKARKKIKISYLEKIPIIDPREAYKQNQLIIPPRTFEIGDIDQSWDQCDVIVGGTADTGAQEHLYIEGQAAYAYIDEKNHVKLYSSTQGPTAVQKSTADILGIPMNQVEVDVKRLGGAFGGKEDQATQWACLAALGAWISRKPVKIILHRLDDMYMTGKRHPYSSDYKIGATYEGKIIAFEATYYQNAGAACDLSPAVLERTLFHANNSYYLPNFRGTAISCKTNLPPNTAFRGFGGPQGMFVIEAALSHLAEKLGKEKIDIQRLNLLKSGDSFHYGQIAEKANAITTWDEAEVKFDLSVLRENVKEFNKSHTHIKKGLAIMPICFGISFSKTSMNQAGSLVHIYFDGSVGISTAAVEMGQGVNTRLAQVPVEVFSIDPSRVKIESTNTTRVANTSPSAASSTHDLNGKATQLACEILLIRLKQLSLKLLNLNSEDIDKIEIKDELVYFKNNKTDITWEKLTHEAFENRIDLSEHGFYKTPIIQFDNVIEKGHPFAYHTYGTAIIEITLDCIRGVYVVDSVKAVHDSGKILNEIIDIGQLEGGIVQGIGWMTSEEIVYDEKGRLHSNALSTYKIPDFNAAPKEIIGYFLENQENKYGLFKSKAIGEPPLMYGIGVYFAIREAIKSFNPLSLIDFKAPLTHEKALLGLYSKRIIESVARTSAEKIIN